MKLFNSPNSAEKRSCERLNLEKELKLYLFNDEILECKSTDISLGGINLVIYSQLDASYIGTNATIAINEIDKLFDCKIVRIEQNQVAIEIDRKHASSFGMALTLDMFNR